MHSSREDDEAPLRSNSNVIHNDCQRTPCQRKKRTKRCILFCHCGNTQSHSSPSCYSHAAPVICVARDAGEHTVGDMSLMTANVRCDHGVPSASRAASMSSTVGWPKHLPRKCASVPQMRVCHTSRHKSRCLGREPTRSPQRGWHVFVWHDCSRV
jgi:hypothetical protein